MRREGRDVPIIIPWEEKEEEEEMDLLLPATKPSRTEAQTTTTRSPKTRFPMMKMRFTKGATIALIISGAHGVESGTEGRICFKRE